MKSPLFYNISRFLLAALFLFSGFAKGVNPFGLSIQFGDYFSAMGLSFLRPMSVVGAIVLPAAEFLLGAMLLCGIFRRVTAWGVMIFMTFFTLLTLWIAILEPVSDCGCFGDLLVISNWATFWKNIAFIVPTIIVFMGRNGTDRRRYVMLASLAVIGLALPAYSYTTLPLIDATPYKIGVNIESAMSGATPSESHTILIYKDRATGALRNFEIADTTWQDDSKWEFVDSRTEILKMGYTPPIHSLSMLNERGEDVVGEIITRGGRTLLFITPESENISVKERAQIAQIAAMHLAAGDSVAMVHSSITDIQIAGVKTLTADQTTLRTIIQHHRGGAMLIQNGIIIDKWPMRKILSKAR